MGSRHDADLTLTRWQAVSRRDAGANSSFFYGAITTRIFCRPTCPGRLARRSNVVFFDDQEHASRSGYRPCKRCQPCNSKWSRDSRGQVLAGRARELIAAAVAGETSWTVESCAAQLSISGAHLHRIFRKHFRTTPKAYAGSLQAIDANMGQAIAKTSQVDSCWPSEFDTTEQSGHASHQEASMFELDWAVFSYDDLHGPVWSHQCAQSAARPSHDPFVTAEIQSPTVNEYNLLSLDDIVLEYGS
jgi:methylphosphotriester-DNA--protein-cysteine methyltransferase